MISQSLYLDIMSFSLGAIIGSFLNALIYRIPRNIGINHGRSKCPGCDKTIPFFHNIPIISYILLLGKCHQCDFKIPKRYFFVEVFSALMFMILRPSSLTLLSIEQYFYLVFILSLFLIHFFVDVEHKILPDKINFALLTVFSLQSFRSGRIEESLIGAAIGFFIPFIVTYLFYKIKGKVGLGGGDIKLFGALGIALGPVGILYNITLSCFLGSVVFLILIISRQIKKDDPLAFGPSILIVAFCQIFFPESFKILIAYF